MTPHRALLSGLIWFSVTQCCQSRPSDDCDSGETNLVTDLLGPDDLTCQELWTQIKHLPDIDTKYPIKHADYICMDTPIIYNDSIPSHGPHRPVGAESGEYRYCPPQRWLNNLKNGAVVLLYHPCVSAVAHRSLAVLAHSCVPHYILTPHPLLSQQRPLAMVTWGRSLEMSQVTLGVCDWLLSISSNITQANTSQRAKYSLYLTKPAPVHRPLDANQEMSELERLKSLKRCCIEALSLNKVKRTRGKRRTIRMVLNQSEDVKNEVKPDKMNRTESITLNLTNTSQQDITKEMVSLTMLTVNGTQMLRSGQDSKEPGQSAKDKKTEEKQSEIRDEKQIAQDKVVEGHKNQIDKKSHRKTIAKGRKHRIKTDTEEQRSRSDCGGLGQCGVPDSGFPHIEGPSRRERIPVPRTDEAVWAAAALGFLLVLLTLSVLHTRLYRHCRSPRSLYWHDDQQDYENVGDIIRRRLRMVGRRKRRNSHSRRQECALLSISSTDENSD